MAAPYDPKHRHPGAGNPQAKGYQGSPIPGGPSVAESRLFRAAERRARKEAEARKHEEHQTRQRLRAAHEDYKRMMEAAERVRLETRWERLDGWQDWVTRRLLDEPFQPPGGRPVPERFRPFFEHHWQRRKPAHFRAGHFERMPLADATFENLCQRWGDVEVEVQVNRQDATRYEIEGALHKRRMAFGTFLGMLKHGEPNSCYMTANNAGANAELLRLLRTHLDPLPDLLHGTPEQGFLWIGRGSYTPLHHDLTHNLMFQLVGTKLVTLYPPGMHRAVGNHRHVYASEAPAASEYYMAPTGTMARRKHDLQITLCPGEALFIPMGWWHEVQAMHEQTSAFDRYVWYNALAAKMNIKAPLPRPTHDIGPDGLNITYTSYMFPWDNHSWHSSFPG